MNQPAWKPKWDLLLEGKCVVCGQPFGESSFGCDHESGWYKDMIVWLLERLRAEPPA